MGNLTTIDYIMRDINEWTEQIEYATSTAERVLLNILLDDAREKFKQLVKDIIDA